MGPPLTAEPAGPFLVEAEGLATGAEDRAVNVTRFNHIQIVNGLHGLLHGQEPRRFARPHLRIAHGDGTESTPFPLRHLGVPPQWDVTLRPLRVGFVSGRHPEMDLAVDYYLARNRELNFLESSADREQEVYERTLGLLRELAAGERCAVEAYHTGLELVTVGFYRAVVEAASGDGKVLVLPRVWRGGRVNVSRMIQQAAGALEAARVLADLRAHVASLGRYLELEEEEGGSVTLDWLVERPMLPSERDWLARRARAAQPVIQALFEQAQYRPAGVWRTG